MKLKKIEFLDRLFKLAGCFDELCGFMADERLLDASLLLTLKNTSEKARWIVNFLDDLQKDEKIMLVSYEWQVLPVERLKLTIVTSKANKEFYFNA